MAIDPKLTPEQELARRTRRAFVTAGVSAAAAVGAWEWLARGDDTGADVPGVLRGVLNLNEKVVRSAVYGNDHLAPVFPDSGIAEIRANGDIGMDDDVEDADWKIAVIPYGEMRPVEIRMEEVRGLPRFEETIDFKCVEGWSTITKFAGARVADFIAKFVPGSEKAPYIGLATPNGEYVGLDMPSALHPQALFAYQMNGADLGDDHGAPVRLVTPVKYGIKNIKRIARISFGDTRPPDYWAEHGYDYYAGL